MSPSVAEGVARVRERIAAAAARSGRDPKEVRLVAVTKGVRLEVVGEAAAAGIEDFGENRANDLKTKAESFPGPARWHFVGAVQTNKVGLLDRADLIHGVDRLREAEALEARGDRIDRSWEVLVQVNVAGEAQKGGVAPARVGDLLSGLAAYPRLRPRGLMFVAPQVENAEDVRAMFAELRGLRERFASMGLEELSMGMSDDFEVAVEEGSTIVRIGRAIFRPLDGA